MSTFGPPRKKQKTSTDNDEVPFHYSLHINPDIILMSTNPDVAVNSTFDIEYDDNDPNLFIVKKTPSDYDIDQWLKHHQELGDIANAANLLSKSNLALLIVTGAGNGCDSGLPDYRSSGGFWNEYKPFLNGKTQQLSLYDMSKTDWFHDDPLSAWGFYTHRAKLYRDAVPHSGFNVLIDLISMKSREHFFMTSNIDGQAHKAGVKQCKLYQTHGSLHHLQCLKCCETGDIIPFYDGYNKIEIDEKTLRMKDVKDIPQCKACGGYTRPNVSFFSDTNDTFNAQRILKQKNRFMQWLKPFMNGKSNKELIVLEIGCGKSVHSLRWECQYLSSLRNVTLIRINPTENIGIGKNKEMSKHIILKLTAQTALTAIAKYLKK